MKKLFAVAIAAVLSQTAFATPPNSSTPSQPDAKVEKACYKETTYPAAEPSYLDDATVGSTATSGGTLMTRVPCPADTPADKPKK